MRPPIRISTAQPVSSVTNWLSGLATEIDFDSVPSGTVINNAYTGSGVTFETVALGNVFASDRVLNADTASNVITIAPPPQLAGFHEGQGGIRVTFKTPQLFVSINAHPILTDDDPSQAGTNTPYLKVFGAPIQLPNQMHAPAPLLAWFNFPLSSMDPNYESWRTISYVSTSPTPDIASVILSCSYSGIGAPVYVLFDTLRFAHKLPITGIWDRG